MGAIGSLVYLYNKSSRDDFYRDAIYQILLHIWDVPRFSTYKMAEICYISPTTLRRISQRIGYESYADFKNAVSKEIEVSEGEIVISPEEVSWSEDFVLNTSEGIWQGIEELKSVLSEKDFQRAVNLLQEAKRVYLFIDADTEAIRKLEISLIMNKVSVQLVRIEEEYQDLLDVRSNQVLAFLISMRTLSNQVKVSERISELRKRNISVVYIGEKIQNFMSEKAFVQLPMQENPLMVRKFAQEVLISSLLIAYKNQKR